ISCRSRSLESGTIPRRAKYVDLPAPGSPIARTTFRVGRPFRDAFPTSVSSSSSVLAPSLVVGDALLASPRSPSHPINKTANKTVIKNRPTNRLLQTAAHGPSPCSVHPDTGSIPVRDRGENLWLSPCRSNGDSSDGHDWEGCRVDAILHLPIRRPRTTGL